MTKVTIPASSEELEELLNDPGQMRAVLSDAPSFKDFINKYAAAQMSKNDGDIAKQVKEQTQKVLGEWLKETRERDGAVPVNMAGQDDASPYSPAARASLKHGLYNKRAMGAKVDRELPEMRDPGKFFSTIWHNTQVDETVNSHRRTLRNAFAEGVPSEGGFLVPETLRSDLLSVSLETSIVRPRARVIPMETLRVPYPAIDDTSHVSSVYGGIVGYWTEEGAALTASQASFGRIVLEAKKLTAYTEVPNELISDSVVSFTQFINEIFPEALAFYEDDAFINGTGTGSPQGILNSPCIISVDRTTNSVVKFQDIVAMYSRMLPSSLNRAVWIASIDVMPQLLQMVMPTGDTTTTYVAPPLWLTGQQAVGAPQFSLLGRPVIFSEKVPSLGSGNELVFADFGFYLLGDRQSMSASSSVDYKFQNDVTAFRIIERVDGRTWLQSAITPRNGGNTLSPVVGLSATHT